MRSVGLEPLEPYPGSMEHWRCRHGSCGREVKARYSNVKRGVGICRWCAPNAPVDPEAAAALMRSVGLMPLEPYPGTDFPWRCRCGACGTEATPTHGSIKGGQGGCGPCGRRKAGEGISRAWGRRRTLPRKDGDQAETEVRGHELEPLTPYPGPAELWKCRHTGCGRQVEIRLKNLRIGLRACPYCPAVEGGRRRWPADEAEELMRAAGLQPLEPYSGRRQRPWRCHCTGCGRETAPSLGGILAGQGGCRHCADVHATEARKVDPAVAAADMRAAGLEALDPYTTSMTPWRCRCTTCGREVTPTLTKIRTGGGCRFCASHGFDLTAPARVYVMHHHRHNAVKVGIGGTAGRNERVNHHRRAGWALAQDWHFTTGAEAHAVEQAVLQQLRLAGHRPYLSAEVMPNGWTETFDADLITTTALAAFVEAHIERLAAGEVNPVPEQRILRPERWGTGAARRQPPLKGRVRKGRGAGTGQLSLFDQEQSSDLAGVELAATRKLGDSQDG
ncbi:GIY-YIG nuclease family protein [Kitasatospora herbaricolor]|uniref:GIY-YIG nuclease family protein n=1 Tax=Kitasatospora herbaricolor TaxID=68217 RepID=UPI0036D89AF9